LSQDKKSDIIIFESVVLSTFIFKTMTAIALIGFSFSNSFLLICLWAIPLGLGAKETLIAFFCYCAIVMVFVVGLSYNKTESERK
jgi:hypothetical protein